jgi:thymidylate synthase ThyX
MKIKLHTEANPEDNAMLQALYSRSADSVDTHLEKLAKTGSGKFMEQYYLGYGHKSIADCGDTTVYIEGVSMLCAKAFQDNPLYNGQESSSRYIDWSDQPFHDPFGTPESTLIFEEIRQFYINAKPRLITHLANIYPLQSGDKPSVHGKAILAKAFDILRGFLPSGATTNLSWKMSLRKAGEMVEYLYRHPLAEVRDVAVQVHATLLAAYPNSIAALPEASDRDVYLNDPRHYYSDPDPRVDLYFNVVPRSRIKTEITDLEPDLMYFSDLDFYNSRPKYAPLPKHDDVLQKNLLITTMLDFGSYRDIQRHRAGYCGVPIVSHNNGFHPFYIDQLPLDIRVDALALLAKIEAFVKQEWTGLNRNLATKLKLQYVMPMGTLVPTTLTYNLHQALYVAELRSGQTVHATLRPVAQDIGMFIQRELGIRTYCDFTEDSWNTRRGSQDIVSKLV